MTEKVSKKISEWAKELGVKSPDLFRLLQEAGVEDAKSTMTVVSSDAIDAVREAVSALSAKSKKKAASSKASASKARTKKSAAETDAKKDSTEAEAKPKAKARGTKTTTQTELPGGRKVSVTRTRLTKVQPETEEKKEEGSKSADKKASAAASGAKSEAKKAAASKAYSDEKKGDAKSTEKTASPATAKKTVKSVEPPAEAGKENAQGTVISTSISSDALLSLRPLQNLQWCVLKKPPLKQLLKNRQKSLLLELRGINRLSSAVLKAAQGLHAAMAQDLQAHLVVRPALGAPARGALAEALATVAPLE